MANLFGFSESNHKIKLQLSNFLIKKNYFFFKKKTMIIISLQ